MAHPGRESRSKLRIKRSQGTGRDKKSTLRIKLRPRRNHLRKAHERRKETNSKIEDQNAESAAVPPLKVGGPCIKRSMSVVAVFDPGLHWLATHTEIS
jgi:hypothetical protein